MKKIYFSILLISSISLSAQPVLTANDYTPTTGSQLITDNVGYQNEGSAGANQTWNFSTLSSSGVTTTDYKTPSNTPYANNFPLANLAGVTNQGGYMFMKTTSSDVSLVGIVSPGASTIIISYSNPEISMKFPFTFNSSYTDTWTASFNNQSIQYNRSGSSTYLADSYGTLILPHGTYNNVIRVKTVQTYIDVYDAGTGNDTIEYNSIIYTWYKPGIKNHLLSFSTITYNSIFGSSTSSYGTMLNASSTGFFENNKNPMSLKLYPNPAQNDVLLSGHFEGNQDLKVDIFNSIGQSVYSNELKNISGSMNEKFNISTLNAGIYFISVTNEKTKQRSTIRFNHE